VVRGEALRSPGSAALRVGNTDPGFCSRIFRSAWPLTRRFAPTSPREERGEVKKSASDAYRDGLPARCGLIISTIFFAAVPGGKKPRYSPSRSIK
jgi:hypothetical protein